ncbi:hypothetical protein D9615_006710 [Tricholomella constricta]|uniref:Uncharacterized protein n=1 Tax=Tricholomella constricta TaxID=117010 RepID=A0A8H5H741_9AGAR|nr:hypothetical protein D9615_006710 [Tricholomella constricta]
MDYVGPEVEPEEVKEAVRRRRQAVIYALPNIVAWITGRRPRIVKRTETKRNASVSCGIVEEKSPNREPEEADDIEMNRDERRAVGFTTATAAAPMNKHVSFNEDAAIAVPTDDVRSPICSPTPTEVGFGIVSPTPTIAAGEAPKSVPQIQDQDLLPTTSRVSPSPVAQNLLTRSSSVKRSPFISCLHTVVRISHTFLSSLLSPASLGILLAFPIALIPPLKGLFVELPLSSSPSKFSNPQITPAPDGLPPLSILLDTTSFIGAASVPLGLICLGAALARLNVPRDQWRTLPTGAIGMLAVGKIIVTPVLGVGIVRGLVNAGVIGKEDKVLQFVCM